MRKRSESEVKNQELFRLNPYLKFTICGDDEVYVKHGLRSTFSTILKDSNQTRTLAPLIRHFTTAHSLDSFLDLYPEDSVRIQTSLDTLIKQHLLTKCSNPHLTSYFSATQHKLSLPTNTISIGVVGVGFLGSRVISQLSKSGIETLPFADNRHVQSEQEEFPFFYDNPSQKVGDTYVSITSTYLEKKHKSVGPLGIHYTAVTDPEFCDHFKNCDIVVVCMDRYTPSQLFELNRQFLQLKKTWCYACVDGSFAMISPLFIPNETLCFSEFDLQFESSFNSLIDIALYKESQDRSTTFQAVFPPLLDTVSGLVSLLVLQYFSESCSPLYNKTLFYDFEKWSFDSQTVHKLPRCPVCVSQLPTYKNTFS